MPEYDETIELPEKDAADVARLHAVPEDEAPQFHPILEVWTKILEPAAGLRDSNPSPQWCSKIVGKYAGVTFADCLNIQRAYFDLLTQCRDALDWVISTDASALDRLTPEDDRIFNDVNYFNVLLLWQMTFLNYELEWDCTDQFAAAELAAIGEAHGALFGQLGVTAYLDNIQFQFGDADQELMLELLNEMKEEASE